MIAPPIGLTFVIPVLDDARRLDRCLASIRATGAAADIVVVDNGSTDGSPAVAAAHGARVLVLPGRVSALRNAGVRLAVTPVVAFVDADHELASGWVDAAVDALRNPQVVAVGAPYATVGRTWVQRTYDGVRRRPRAPRPVAWLGSGNLAVRREAFVAVGGFDEHLETCEDVDLCRRLRLTGSLIVSDPRLVSRHAGDPATLRAVFAGELWRGRDNLTVSLRQPWDARSVLSALAPVCTLGLLALGLGALAVGAWAWLLAALGLLALPVLGRVAGICTNRRDWRPTGVAQALAVTIVHDAARALALVTRTSHARRRRADRVGAGAP